MVFHGFVAPFHTLRAVADSIVQLKCPCETFLDRSSDQGVYSDVGAGLSVIIG